MSTREKLITARLGMLALAEELQNISKACKVAKVSRSHYYEIKKAYETYGRDGLVPRERRKPGMPNQTPPEIEGQILEMTERYPTFNYFRISEHLRHPFELYLAINEIEHRNTKVHSPQTNGFCERFHQTVGDEFVKVRFRKKIYTTLPELQEDLDAFLEFYNTGRAHQGYRVKGRTPMKALNDYLETRETEVKEAA